MRQVVRVLGLGPSHRQISHFWVLKPWRGPWCHQTVWRRRPQGLGEPVQFRILIDLPARHSASQRNELLQEIVAALAQVGSK